VDTGFPPARSRASGLPVSFDASAGEARSEKIMLKQQAKRNGDSINPISL
jgi:hypothetical protein